MADQLHAIAVGIKLLSIYYGKSAVSKPPKSAGRRILLHQNTEGEPGYITVFLAYMNVLRLSAEV
jgi:hypothetical protein